jgi:hypothetical protein
MGHGHHGAGVAGKELFQPLDGFRVQVVGRFVEQQHVRLLQQQAAQRHAALFAAGQLAHDGIPRRQAQRVGGHVQLVFQRVRVTGGEDRFQTLLFLGQGVEVGAFFGVGGVHGFEGGLRLQYIAHAFLDGLADGVFRVELRLLRQIADLDTGLRAGLALEILVHAGHDLQYRGLAGAIQAQQADLGARIEGQRDVLDDLPLGRDHLADPVHGVDVLRGHAGSGTQAPAPGRGRRAGRQIGNAAIIAAKARPTAG